MRTQYYREIDRGKYTEVHWLCEEEVESLERLKLKEHEHRLRIERDRMFYELINEMERQALHDIESMVINAKALFHTPPWRDDEAARKQMILASLAHQADRRFVSQQAAPQSVPYRDLLSTTLGVGFGRAF